MEKKPPRPMTPFDELTTPYSFSILKLLLPYLSPGGDPSLWIMVKFMELQYTISILKRPGQLLKSQSFGHFPDSPSELLDEIIPYLPPEQAQMADTFHNAMNMMEMMQMFQSSAASSDDAPGTGGINPMDMMMGMLSPEQQEMFQMYQGMFSDNENQENSKTGDDDYERMDEQSAFEKHGSGKTGTDPDGGIPDGREGRQGSGSDSDGPDH